MSSQANTLFLSHKDILSLDISVKECIDTTLLILKEHGCKRTMLPPKPSIVPREGVFFTAIPTYLKDLNISGVKWVSRFPDNKKMPKVMSTIVLNDMQTGLPLAVMDAGWITAMRTGATAALTAKYFGIKHFSTISIMGLGVQSVAVLLCFKEMFKDLKNVKLFEYKDTAQRFVKRFLRHTKKFLNPKGSDKLKDMAFLHASDFNFSWHKDMKDLFHNSDVVVTAPTYAPKPFVKPSWLESGLLALPIHHRGWEKCVSSFDKIVTDDANQLEHYMEGDAPKVYAEIGEVFAGKKKGRKNDREKILAYNIGLAVSDIALADYVYNIAVKEDIGCRYELNNYDGVFWL